MLLPLALLNVVATAIGSSQRNRLEFMDTRVYFLPAGHLAVIASLMVVFLRNVVHCAMALVSALLLIAVLFVTLHAPWSGVAGDGLRRPSWFCFFSSSCCSTGGIGAAARLWWGFGTLLALMLAGVLVPLVATNDLPADRWRRRNYSAVPKCSPKAYLTITCCPSKSHLSYYWLRSSARCFGQARKLTAMIGLHHYLILSA